MTDKELGTAAGEIFAKAFTLGYETGRNYIPAGGMALTAEEWANRITLADKQVAVSEAWEQGFEYGSGHKYGAEDDGVRLTAEQVEDVEALVATANPYSAPAARLRALFPATEPAEDAKPCGSNSVTLGWCKLTARHEGLHTNGTYLWGTPSEPDPPAPAEPAEEETKAEACSGGGDMHPCVLAAGHAGVHTDSRGLGWNYPASSPVVPAPTETGPWQTWQEVPEGVKYKSSKSFSSAVWFNQDHNRYASTPDGERHLSGVDDGKMNSHLPPFVAAEEGKCTICNLNGSVGHHIESDHPFTTDLGPFDDEGNDRLDVPPIKEGQK